MESYEIINYKGYKINIVPDENYNSPEDWGNDDLFLVYDHRDFCVKRKGFDPADIFEAMQEGEKTYGGYHFYPVYAYIHSGVRLQLQRWFNAPQGHNEFDVSFRGFALVADRSDISDPYGYAEGLINEWNDCLSGNVWGYNVEDQEGNDIDSCWGFYGDYKESGLVEMAKNAIDCEINNRLNKRVNTVKTWIKNHVPIDKRAEIILNVSL